MNITLLISEDTIKSHSIVGDNVESKYIKEAIQSAQEMGLIPLLGTKLYEKLCNLISDGTINQVENVNYKKLLDEYVTRFLLTKVVAEIQLTLAFKLRNAGIVGSTDDKNANIEFSNIKYLIKQYQDKSEWYGQRMLDYVNCNTTLFPEKYANVNEDVQSKSDAYQSGIIFY